MFSIPHHGSDPSLAELMRYSARVRQRKVMERSPHQPKSIPHPVNPATWDVGATSENAPSEDAASLERYAAPLMPLRDRDLQALADWFAHEQADDIEANIMENLQQMCPEPCWEDTFEFLQDYL